MMTSMGAEPSRPTNCAKRSAAKGGFCVAYCSESNEVRAITVEANFPTFQWGRCCGATTAGGCRPCICANSLSARRVS